MGCRIFQTAKLGSLSGDHREDLTSVGTFDSRKALDMLQEQCWPSQLLIKPRGIESKNPSLLLANSKYCRRAWF